MVRRATLDRDLRPDDPAAAEEMVPGVTEPAELTARRRQQWRGAGGRWLVWAFRAVVWAVLLVIGFRGVASIVASPDHSGSKASGGPAPSTARSGFPAGLAEAFALQFGSVYLNFSPATAAQRASNLTPFIPVGADPQFGWNGAGSQRLLSEQVASVTVENAHQAMVTLLARISAGQIELGVPVYSDHGGLVVSAEPAMLPGPERATPPPGSSAASDSAVTAALTSQLRGFFRAYANGDQEILSRFLAPHAVITGLGGAVTLSSISGVEVPPGGPIRQIVVSVMWQVVPQSTVRVRARQSGRTSSVSAAPSGLEMTYEMTVVRQNGSWYVKAIGPANQQPGGT